MLSDMKIKNFKPMEKFYKVTDGDGLYVHVSETGSKSFRYRYRFNGKQKVLTFGMYPYISLSDARKMKEDAKGQLAHGIDPNAAKRAFKQEEITEKETFELIAREWLGKFSANWSDGYADRILSSFERDVFPFIGTTPIKSVNAPLLLTVLRRIESRGALDTAHRVRGNVGMVLRYGVATGRCERDCTGDLKGALPPAIEQHMAAITEPKKLGELLRAIDAYKGSEHVKAALKLAPMLFVRPLNLRSMKWEDVNLDTAEWNIPGAEMKMRDAHLVPLATQAVSILETLKEFTGNYKYCFPHFRDIKRCMSDNALLSALRIMGYPSEVTSIHGFRATARTIMAEVLDERIDLIEHQLAHAVKDPNGIAYNRTKFLAQRRLMMQRWADYLDGLKVNAVVLPFKQMES